MNFYFVLTEWEILSVSCIGITPLKPAEILQNYQEEGITMVLNSIESLKILCYRQAIQQQLVSSHKKTAMITSL